MPRQSISSADSRPLPLQGNDCQGIDGSYTFIGDTNPANPPPGWEQDIPFDGQGSNLIFEIMSCDRVSWGPFERPLTILIETHSDMEPPQACREESVSGVMYGMIRMWISDAEVASWANATFGLPTLVLEWNETLDTMSEIDTYVWTWSANGQTPSRVEFRTTSALGTAEGQSPQRVAWTAGSRLWLADIQRYATQNLGGQPDVFVAELQEPMFLATAAPARPVVVTGDYVFATSMSYSFLEFGDYECVNPI